MTEKRTVDLEVMDGREAGRFLTEGMLGMGAEGEHESRHDDHITRMPGSGIAFGSRTAGSGSSASRSATIANTKPRDRRHPVRGTEIMEVIR